MSTRYTVGGVLFLLLASGVGTANSQSVRFRAGFRVIRTTDSTRLYKPGSAVSDPLHYRPVDIDMWYPATTVSTDTAMIFQNFLDIFGDRANYYTASNAGDGLAKTLSKAFCDQLKCSTPKALLKVRTASFENAAPAEGKFPIVLYMSSYNGLGYENYQLLERLASHGFIVMAIGSVGRFPGDMTMQKEDMMEQTGDALSALKAMRHDAHVDFSRIGLVGYSWGGVGNAALSNSVGGVSCVISLDGSEFHHYEGDKREDGDFDGIKNSDDFKNLRITAPYLRLESSSPPDNKKNRVFDFSTKLFGDYLILKVDSAEHGDFCSIPSVVKASGKCRVGRSYINIVRLTESFLNEHLKDQKNFAKTLAQLAGDVKQVVRR